MVVTAIATVRVQQKPSIGGDRTRESANDGALGGIAVAVSPLSLFEVHD